MAIHVTSEIGTLKKIMLHRPGKELEQLVPRELERLLFDDIPYLKTARQEHEVFADILRTQGIEVVYLEDLMAETLKQNPDLKRQFVLEFIQEGGSLAQFYKNQLLEFLDSVEDEKELVLKTMSGVQLDELKIRDFSPLVKLANAEDRFVLDPMPNLYFTRDPFASIGEGVS